MIIITDANGNLQAPTIPENVYQGSNNANSIVFLSPLAQSNTATIMFRLPNGLLTTEMLMTPYTNVPSEYELNAWVRDIDDDITALYGAVSFQIKLTNASGTVVTSVMGTFNVQRGVAPLPSTTPSTTNWSEILAYVSQINSDIENGWLVSKGILPYDSTFTYPLNASVWNKANNTIYTSLVANNKGNALTDTTKWGATALFSSADLTALTTRVTTAENNITSLTTRMTTAENDIDTLDAIKADVNDIPTKTSDLTNDSGFVTNAVNDLTNYYLKTQTYTKTEVDNLISAIPSVKFQLVSVLPTASATTWFNNSKTIYLVPSATQTTGNIRDEYITIKTGSNGTIPESLTVTSTAGMILTFTTDIDDYVTAIENQALSTTDTFTFEYKALPLSVKYTVNGSTEITITRDAEEDGTGYYYWFDNAHGVAYYTDTPVITADTYVYEDSTLEHIASSLDFVSIESYSTTDGYWYSDDLPDAETGEYGVPVNLSDYGISYTGTPTIGTKFTTTYTPEQTNVDTYAWEQIGSTAIDLTNYYTKTQTDDKIAETNITALRTLDTVYGTPTVDYNTTDGITIESVAQLGYGYDGATRNFGLTQEIPLVPADGTISMDADASNEKVEIKVNGLKTQTQSEVTDLTNTTWLLNSSVTTAGDVDYSVNFNMNYYNGTSVEAKTGDTLKFSSVSTDPVIKIFNTATTYATMYENSAWDSTDGVNTYTPTASADIQALRTITITGGTDVTNSALLTWIKANATLQNTIITGQQIKTNLANAEVVSNKVTSLSSSSTDTQYPSAKCVYDLVGNIDTLLTALDSGSGV